MCLIVLTVKWWTDSEQKPQVYINGRSGEFCRFTSLF